MNLTDEQKDAFEAISEEGQSAVLTRVISSYDSVHGLEVVQSVTHEDVVVITFPISKESINSFDETLISDFKRGKAKFFYMASANPTTLSQTSLDPRSGDLLSVDGKIWEVSGKSELAPAGIPILFYIGVRESVREELPSI